MLDYGAWVSTLSRDDVIDIAEKYLPLPFETAFEETFESAPPDELNAELQLTVVASALDSSSERIVAYLRTFGVPINAVFFTCIEDDDRRYLARSWLAVSADTPASTLAKSTSKRAPWNGVDWYVSFGGDRPWEDARQFGFIAAGGGKFYSQTIRSLPVGARVWVNVPGTGFVGVGTVAGAAARFEQASVLVDGEQTELASLALAGEYWHQGEEIDEKAEWVVPVTWLATLPEKDAYWVKGMFASQHSACKLRQEFTLERLAQRFNIDGAGE